MRTVRRYLLLLIGIYVALAATPLAADSRRTLVLAIDSIPYRSIETYLRNTSADKSMLRRLDAPAALISTVPSLSNLAWSGILEPMGVEMPDGYKGKYYDYGEEKVVGMLSHSTDQASWHDFFDWKIDGLWGKASAYARPASYSNKELHEALEAFSRSTEPLFFAYIVSTDALGHLYGDDGILEFLQLLDQTLLGYAKQDGSLPFNLVILSDHGIGSGDQLQNTWPAVKASLSAAGYHLSNKINGPESVALIPLGMLSGFEVFSNATRQEQLAARLTTIEGVDICVTKTSEAIQVFGKQGAARIYNRRIDAETWFRYESDSGDPLGLNKVVEKLQLRGGAGNAGNWFPESWWLEETGRARYPDSLYRITHSFTAVRNPANILCSNAPGYAFGGTGIARLASFSGGGLRWTHGGLRRDESLGFIVTNHPDWTWQDTFRFNQALQFLSTEGRVLPVTASVKTTGSHQ